MPHRYDIEIIAAPSILGLRPTGVERLAGSLLSAGLQAAVQSTHELIQVPALNDRYSALRDAGTQCLNPQSIAAFSRTLSPVISASVTRTRFPLVLGGDCSILLGIMPGLKRSGRYGLIFFDAHADFYAPGQSPTGEVADMDLAMVTGRGPALLTDLDGLRPYVQDADVIHIGQRDEAETRQYHAQDIRTTAMHCYSLADITRHGVETVAASVKASMNRSPLDGYWIHFDTDVLSDEINPAVDYRLPGGLDWEQTAGLLHAVLGTGRITGLGITIFNPSLDKDDNIARQIVNCIGRAFRGYCYGK